MTKTTHTLYIRDARSLDCLKDESVHLVVTSPPYPMIQMWDELFGQLASPIREALETNQGPTAFELMHRELDRCWQELARVLMPGALACINIGDATRSIGDSFALYSNHARIIQCFYKLGFTSLPLILWRKPTNSPTKFMGSGMLPGGAYVTLEHEYILIFRKGGKRQFKTEEDKRRRRESAYFWEERNIWFSDIWQLAGVRQLMPASSTRERSAAFPFELAYRLINMYSLKDDLVLDPFLGTGTTMLAALAGGRNSAGVELDGELVSGLLERIPESKPQLDKVISDRLAAHEDFISAYQAKGKKCKYLSTHYGFPVVTNQEKELRFELLKSLTPQSSKNSLQAVYR